MRVVVLGVKTRGIINFTMPGVCTTRMGADGECLVTDTHWPHFPPTVLSRMRHVRNACMCLLVYLRDISHYQGEPTVDHRDEGGEGEREENGALIFFFFLSGRCVGAHRRTRTRARSRLGT